MSTGSSIPKPTPVIDKTQVVYLIENDHITHRSLHVQLVSSFARGIAEILRLNLDLVEAIALGTMWAIPLSDMKVKATFSQSLTMNLPALRTSVAVVPPFH